MSNETKWTPGQWSPYQGEDTNWWWVITDHEGCELGSGDGGFYEQDAHLIAAAPELYILLEAAACPSCDGSGAFYQGDGHVTQCQWCHERDAALAKARG